MAQIALEGMRFHAFHGVHEAEQIIGSEFVVDIFVRASIAKAGATDNVALTINYETIYQLCRLEMEKTQTPVGSSRDGYYRADETPVCRHVRTAGAGA